MSKVSELRKMFEKGKTEDNGPPIKPLPPKFNSSKKDQEPKKEEKPQKAENTVVNEESRVSVSDMRKNLQGKINFNHNPMQKRGTTYEAKEHYLETQERRDPNTIKPEEGKEKMPTFNEARQNLMKLHERQSQQKEEELRKKETEEQRGEFIIEQNEEGEGEKKEEKEENEAEKNEGEVNLNLRQPSQKEKRNLGNFDDF